MMMLDWRTLVMASWLGLCAASTALGNREPRLVPRSDINTLPFTKRSKISKRDFDSNVTTTAGLARVSLADDRQSYFTTIRVGDVHYRVALDTASADLWLVSSDCDEDQCEDTPRFPLKYQSPTFGEVDGNQTTFQAGYADGTVVSGFLAREKVALPRLAIPDQLFGLVSNTSVALSDRTSGLLGLGFPRLSAFPNVTNSAPFFSNLAQKGLLEYPVFGFHLTWNDTGSLAIGAIDASVVSNASEIGWNQVASFPPFGAEDTQSTYLHWATPISSFSVNYTAVATVPTYPAMNEGRTLALIDIGAAGIYGPLGDVSKLFSMISGARIVHSDKEVQWAIPCDTDVPISFAFGSRDYTLLPEDYIIGPASGNPNLCLSWPKAHGPHSDGIDWQFGTAFLRTVYSIFSYGINDKEPPHIGFYSLRNETLMLNTTRSSQIEDARPFFSAHSATLTTTLPNILLPTPTFSTLSYIFNASVAAPLNLIVPSGLATSTYSALLGADTTFLNASAVLPTVAWPMQSVTRTITDESGQTQVMVAVEEETESPTLGLPPGWSAASTLRASLSFCLVYPLLALVISSVL